MEEKDKLTIQEAARYLGQDIQISEIYYPEDFIYDVGDIVDLDSSILHRMEQLYFTGKLILRSIEDMTEEEQKHLRALEVALSSQDDFKKYFFQMSEITNYLRSIGVDCDDLIKQGKAIRKEIKCK